MFRALADPSARKCMSPTLRADIYSAIDQIKPWLVGAPCGAGDGVSYQPILARIHEHFPNTTIGLDAARSAEHEAAVLVGGITNMILEMSRWDGMAGAMAMRTWVDALCDAHGKIQHSDSSERVGRGITRGIHQFADVGLMTKEFAARVQIISLLKTVNTHIHGAGTDAARQGDALWSSKFI